MSLSLCSGQLVRILSGERNWTKIDRRQKLPRENLDGRVLLQQFVSDFFETLQISNTERKADRESNLCNKVIGSIVIGKFAVCARRVGEFEENVLNVMRWDKLCYTLIWTFFVLWRKLCPAQAVWGNCCNNDEATVQGCKTYYHYYEAGGNTGKI